MRWEGRRRYGTAEEKASRRRHSGRDPHGEIRQSPGAESGRLAECGLQPIAGRPTESYAKPASCILRGS